MSEYAQAPEPIEPSRPVRTRVKICGLTRAEDVRAAVDAGADAIGLVFHPASPRAVSIEQARSLCAALPPFVTAVGLFVDAPAGCIARVLEQVPLELLQFHGEEPADLCASFGRRWIKAIRMRPGLDAVVAVRAYLGKSGGAAGILLDAFDPVLAGGTGQSFEWGRIPPDLAPSIVLAGGLTPANIADAIRAVRPFGVDVSGGVESARGIKDGAKISAFMQGVRDGDSARFDP
jgi:phosphoribosylanthranilate isomerase